MVKQSPPKPVPHPDLVRRRQRLIRLQEEREYREMSVDPESVLIESRAAHI